MKKRIARRPKVAPGLYEVTEANVGPQRAFNALPGERFRVDHVGPHTSLIYWGPERTVLEFSNYNLELALAAGDARRLFDRHACRRTLRGVRGIRKRK